jgi:hypothetical protein
MVELVL